jgi:hypothetical protein
MVMGFIRPHNNRNSKVSVLYYSTDTVLTVTGVVVDECEPTGTEAARGTEGGFSPPTACTIMDFSFNLLNPTGLATGPAR